MTVDMHDPHDLSADDARALTQEIYGQLETAWHLIIRAYAGRAWLALGYDTWDAYCKAEFNGARLRLPREERRDVVSSLRDAGLSTRAIASATGVDQATVVRDRKSGDANTSPDEDDAMTPNVPPATSGDADASSDPDATEASAVTGIDGKRYAATRPSVTDLISGDELAELNASTSSMPPAPSSKPRRRAPITTQATDVGWSIRKNAERIRSLADDERFTRNVDQMITALRGHLIYVRDTADAVLQRLDQQSGV